MELLLKAVALLALSSMVSGAEPASSLVLNDEDRVLILAPHPDDETIGTGGVLQEVVSRKIPVRVVYFTYGDGYEWSFWAYKKHPVISPSAVRAMGEVRRGESLAAAKLLGVPIKNIVFLGYPDWGTLRIWNSHWGAEPPFKSMLTQTVAVPYADAYRRGALYKGEEIVRDLEKIIQDFNPTKIFVSHPGDQHPDHEALYLFTQVALWNSAYSNVELKPYLVHFKNWPRPEGLSTNNSLLPPAALGGDGNWEIHTLRPKEKEVKLSALEAHRTQFNFEGRYLESFVKNNELFGDFPALVLGAENERHSIMLSSGVREPEDLPFDFTENQRAGFVGIEKKTLHVGLEELIFTLRLTRPLAKETGFSVYAFGYRGDIPFETMPKIHVHVGPLRHSVQDQSKLLPFQSVRVHRQSRNIEIRIPMALLHHPSRLLTSSRCTFLDLPMDWTAWRVVNLPKSLP